MLRKTILMIPAIFLWLGINAVQAQTRLSIEDCRRMALENSDDIKISSRKVGKGGIRSTSSKNSLFPENIRIGNLCYIFENIDMGMWYGNEYERYVYGRYYPATACICRRENCQRKQNGKNRRSNLGRKQKAYPNQYPGRGGADVLDVCFGSGKGKTAYTIYSIVGFVASAGQQFFLNSKWLLLRICIKYAPDEAM